jgi:hypothetical protein
MDQKRSFSKQPECKAVDYHGACKIEKLPVAYTEPDSNLPKSINLHITFEEAMKLSVSIQSCIQSLNKYNRNRKEGKDMSMCVSIKFQEKQIAIIEELLRKKS